MDSLRGLSLKRVLVLMSQLLAAVNPVKVFSGTQCRLKLLRQRFRVHLGAHSRILLVHLWPLPLATLRRGTLPGS